MQHAVRFEQEARFFTLGQAGPHPAWLVCHGYGQLASYFIRHFQPLADVGHYIVAPEGLSRFYLKNSSGRVGASWMTREARETDIANYLRYLDAVALQGGLAGASELNLLGFSQGVATICRWAMHTQLSFKKLVLWAGVFPPDVSPDLCSSRLCTAELYQVWGNRDPYLDREKLQEQTTYLQSLKAHRFYNISFEGAHSLHAPSLLSIATGSAEP